MKIAILYSTHCPGFLNHYLRLKGFLDENPGIESVWFDLRHLPLCSGYSLGKFDKFILLSDKDKLQESELKPFSHYKMAVENLALDNARKIQQVPQIQTERRWVFCASGDAEKKWNKNFWEQSNRFCPTLFLCQDQETLERGAPPGDRTFFSPVNPQLHLEALFNASCVLSFFWEPCLVAQSAGKTAIKLTNQAESQNRWGIKEVSIKGKKPKQVFEECREILEKSMEVSSPARATIDKSQVEKGALHLTSISDFSYLPFYLGMIENLLLRSEKKVNLHLLALDNQVRPFLEVKYPGLVKVYELQDVWNPEELKIIKKRTIAFQAFSSKPRIIERVLKDTKSPTFHCDSDVYFFSHPDNLLETFSTGHTVLFPHWNDAFPEGRNDGLYNAGMIGVRPGAEKFVKWWGDQCLANCSFNMEKGVVGDQAYLDFAPILFDGITLYRKKDHNIARWNLKTLGICFSANRTQLKGNEGQTIQTFHAAFIDSSGFFEFKFCWDQLVTFFSGFPLERASAAFKKNTLIQQQRYWLSLSRGLKSREVFYKFFPLLGEQREEKVPTFWVEGLGGRFLRKALKLRDILTFKPANPR